MSIIQRDIKNDETQFIFPHPLVVRSVAFIKPPYLQPIKVSVRAANNIEVLIRKFVENTPASVVREMRITKNSIIVCYAHDRDRLSDHAKQTERLLQQVFDMEIIREGP